MTPRTSNRRWRNAPVVREPDKARTRGLAVIVLWMAAAVAPFTLYLVQQMEKHFFGSGADVASGYVPPAPR